MVSKNLEQITGYEEPFICSVPILFLVWVRPEVTEKVFSQIRKVKPKRLYVAIDGPRNDKEKELIEKTLEVINVDWDCDVNYLKQDKNLGCKKAVSEAITWFFNNEEMGIILEDDCYPDLSFFPFCEELLNKYKDDTRVVTISGRKLPSDGQGASYGFHRVFDCWGWASWRRAWRYFDIEMPNFEQFKSTNAINKYIIDRWTRVSLLANFNLYAPKEASSWAFVFLYNLLCQNSLIVKPYKNLISNIGLGIVNAAHTVSPQSDIALEKIDLPLVHPCFVGPDSVCNNSNILNYICNITKVQFLRVLSNFMPTKKLRHQVRNKARSYLY